MHILHLFVSSHHITISHPLPHEQPLHFNVTFCNCQGSSGKQKRDFRGLAHATVEAGKAEIRRQASSLEIQVRADVVLSPKSTDWKLRLLCFSSEEEMLFLQEICLCS